MKSLCFAALLLVVSPVFAGDKSKVSVDGNWVVVCMEKDGAPVSEAKDSVITAKGDTFKCSKTGMTWKIDFADKGMVNVQATEGEGKAPVAKTGVCVQGNDFIALCLHDANSSTSTDGAQKNKCTILLKREGASK
ncbi:hypothetical protein BH11PLA2_BH11PLA2_45500 [soil metagenome]